MDKIKQFINLVQENPTLAIICMVDYEVVCGDDYARWEGRVGASRVDEVYRDEDRIWFKENNLHQLKEEIEHDLWEGLFEDCDTLTENEEVVLAEEVERELSKILWQKVIVLNIDL